MNNLANQFGSLNFGGQQQSNTGFNTQPSGGFNNQPSGGFNNNTKVQSNSGKNDGFDDFQVAKPTSNITTTVVRLLILFFFY